MTMAVLLACKPPTPPPPESPPPDRAAEAAAFVTEVDARLLGLWRAEETAAWAYETDLTDSKAALAAAGEEKTMAFLSDAIPRAARYDGVEVDPQTRRELHLLKLASTLPAPSDPAKRAELATIGTRLSATYGKGEWCPPGEACLDIGGIEEILATSDDPARLRAAWEGWHAIAPPMRQDYVRFVALSNEGAREIGFADTGELWRSGYDMTPAALEADMDRLWAQVKPLYDALHCHVRAGLSREHGAAVVPPAGPMPAHVLGNLWAQDWTATYRHLVPYPDEPSLDVTQALEEQEWDATRMTKTAEAFFTGLGLDPLPTTFWERSMFVQPEGRDVVCHASAWDPGWNDDLRIKMCIRPTMDDLVTLHHELGHLYYFHEYRHLPTLFRSGANDGFHEAIGDTVALSITPAYLHELGLLSAVSETEHALVNTQLQRALDKVAFLPFGLLIDRWRWEVFDGRIPPERYNEGWWRLKRELQGVAPPAARGEEWFDPGAKYHVPGNTPYLRYFIADILQFQLHRALCREAGFQGPLHACSVRGNAAAGAKLEALLELGASRPWQDALEAATGQRELDATAMVDYFQPLSAWLGEQNRGRTCGW